MDRDARHENANTAATAKAGGRLVAASSSTLFEEGRNCYRVVRAHRAAMLVDAEVYFKAFMQAAERATRSIVIVGWDFDTRVRLHCGPSRPGVPDTLGAFLNYLVKRNRKLHVYILNWDYPLVFGTDREFPPLYGWKWRPHRRVHLKYDNTHPTGASHHQKIVAIDDAIGFSGGLDLTSRRWDTCEHRADEPRRVSGDVPYPPFHDVMAAVDGEAAQVLAGIARERWRLATGEKLRPPASIHSDPWPTEMTAELTEVVVAVSRSVPEAEGRAAVKEVEALYLDMIARARRYLYIENQYFTSHRIADALAARLAEPEGPEIVLVVRLLSHGWLEEHTMEVLRSQNLKKLLAADVHGRFRVYYPHVPCLKEGTCLDIHSKVLIVDDEWLRIGSANICNRSMGLDTECDLTFEAGGDAHVSEIIRGFRNRLLGEHLGVEPTEVQSRIEASGSINPAIAAMQGEGRTLKTLDKLPEWSPAVIEAASIADPEGIVELDLLVKEFSSDMTTDRSRPAWGKLLMIALLIAGLTAAWHYTPLKELVNAERISTWADEFSGKAWAPLVVLAAYTPACFVMFPRPLITLFAVLAFGPWLGFTYAMSGVLIAALVTYYAGRLMGRRRVQRIAGSKIARLSEVLRENGLLAVTALRLVPIAPFFVEGLVAGAIRIKLRHFMVGTFIGMLPGALAATIFGDQLEAALHDPSRINYGVVVAVALVFVVGTLAVRAWLKTQIRGASAGKHRSVDAPAHARATR